MTLHISRTANPFKLLDPIISLIRILAKEKCKRKIKVICITVFIEVLLVITKSKNLKVEKLLRKLYIIHVSQSMEYYATYFKYSILAVDTNVGKYL